MANLDYAYLADYAAVENGRLTAVGASFTHMYANALPAHRMIAVAGRVRLPADSDGFDLRIEFQGPGAVWQFDVGAYIASEDVLTYEGKKGSLFAVQTTIPLVSEGVYEARVLVDGHLVRTLKFELTLADQ